MIEIDREGACRRERVAPGFSAVQMAIPAERPRITRMLFAVPRYGADASPIGNRFQGLFAGKVMVSTVMDPAKNVSAQSG